MTRALGKRGVMRHWSLHKRPYTWRCVLARWNSPPISFSRRWRVTPTCPSGSSCANSAGWAWPPPTWSTPARLLEKQAKAFKLIETSAGRSPARRAALRLRAGGNARRGGAVSNPSASRRWTSTWAARCARSASVGGGSAMMTELDKTAAPGPRHGGGRENSRHRQDAPRLGRREPHRARPGPRAGGRRAWRRFSCTAARASRASAAR